MRLKGIIITLIAVIAAVGLGVGLGLGSAARAATKSTQQATTASQATAAAVGQYVVFNCNNQPVVAPKEYVLACADGGYLLTGLHWTTWSSRLASGYGTVVENLCVPNCASGKLGHYPADVVLWGSRAIKGGQHYAELTVIYTGKERPPVYQTVNGKVVSTYPVTFTIRAQ
jgi:hypothetical protein